MPMDRRVGTWAVVVVACAFALGCGGGGDGGGSEPPDAGAGGDVQDTATPSQVRTFTAKIQSPGDDAPHEFRGSLLVQCVFDDPTAGQLRISGTAFEAGRPNETLELRLGVYPQATFGAEGQTFLIKGIVDPQQGGNVAIGEAAIAYKVGDDANPDVVADSVTSGQVVLTSLDPCQGTFEAELTGTANGELGQVISITDGVFEITPSPLPGEQGAAGGDAAP